MRKPSPDAAAILALPHRHHPALARAVAALAAEPDMPLDTARRLLDATCADLGISSLDVEMVQPGVTVPVPFAPSASPTASTHDDAVRQLVHARLRGGRR